ncbi:MAG: PA14 domain-containing protein, partial [Candidatus Aenigmatarchaeota archaeon]
MNKINNKIFILSVIFFLFFMIVGSVLAESQTIQLQEGWNMFSMPVNKVIDKDELSKYCSLTSPLWYYSSTSKQYERANDVGPGIGYWVKVASPCTINLEGDALDINDFPGLKAGTNQIAALSEPVEFSYVTGNCVVVESLKEYDSFIRDYVEATVLEPGKSYFVDVERDCKLGAVTPETCSEDGIAYGSCSSDKPRYCDDGILVDRCSECYCPSGYECQDDGTCKITEPCPSDPDYPTDEWNRVWCDMDFTEKITETSKSAIQFDNDWGFDELIPGHFDYVGFRSGRSIYFPIAGMYTFTVGSDDGVKVSIDGVSYLDRWEVRSYDTDSFDVSMIEGYHNVRIDYYEDWLTARVSFTYELKDKCSDDTLYGQCSSNKPRYCDDGILVDRCSECYCPSGYECQDDETCKVPACLADEKQCPDGSWVGRDPNNNCEFYPCGQLECEDGTAYGLCSSTKPKYCSSGTLVNNCQDCGCPSDQTCQSGGTCIELECTNGNTRKYTCLDDSQVDWCVCQNNQWDCITSPELQCQVTETCPTQPNYPTHMWDRTWCNMEMTEKIADSPEETSLEFNNDWGLGELVSGPGFMSGYSDQIGFTSGRKIYFPVYGDYTFTVGSDDGVIVWIDDEPVLNAWRDRGYKTDTFVVTLDEGYHNVRIDYYENGGSA